MKKRVEDVMPIATGHEREELQAELEVLISLVLSNYSINYLVLVLFLDLFGFWENLKEMNKKFR